MARNVLLKLNRVLSRLFATEQARPPKDTPARRDTFRRVHALEEDLKRQGFVFDDEPIRSGMNR